MNSTANVDRSARKRAAEILRRFCSGRITNDAFEDACPETDDAAIHAIWETSWAFYDDFKKHKLIGRYRLTLEQRTLFKRMVLFLDSDNPYQWPDVPFPGIDPHQRRVRGFWDAMFRPSPLPAAVVDRFLSAGFYPVWPFLTKKDYLRAMDKPKRLSGRKKGT